MIKTSSGAQRYNARMDKIWNEAKRLKQEILHEALRNIAEEDIELLSNKGQILFNELTKAE
jgi:hypothetical protein